MALTALVAGRVRRSALHADTANVDGWFQRVLEELVTLVAVGWRRARDTTSGYLIDHAAVEGVAVDPTLATWVTDRVVTSLRVAGPVKFKEHVRISGDPAAAGAMIARTLPASSQRLILAGARDTTMATVRDSGEIVGWRRVTDADPCAFCSMLASRGAAYSKTTVEFHAHDGDECTAEPLYEREVEPLAVLDLQEKWRQATAGTSGSGSLRAWRRYWDNRQARES